MRLTKDLASGLMFVAFGLVSILLSSAYDYGTPSRMGPGFFPTALGALIVLLGAVLTVRALTGGGPGEAVDRVHLRPFILVSASVAVFGVAVQHLGLFPAIIALVVLGRLADREGSWPETLLISAVLCALCYVVFSLLLEVRIPLVTW